MRDDVINRLKSLGYTVTDEDGFGLMFVIDKVTNTVKNECNISEIPDGLYHIAIDMVCGEFLLVKKKSGQLADFDVENAVKQIKEGDTSITYAVADSMNAFDALIEWLINKDRMQFATFRRFKW
jgi:hypothetical protein